MRGTALLAHPNPVATNIEAILLELVDDLLGAKTLIDANIAGGKAGNALRGIDEFPA
jgi:hypothetical protein